MLLDQFEIQFGLLRSRIKRIIIFVNQIIDEEGAQPDNKLGYTFKNKDERLAQFKKISSNYFEEEYEPSRGNGFSKIIDFNLEGTARYSNLIDQECLNVVRDNIDIGPKEKFHKKAPEGE
eukprot:CAMPEP_0114590338 /NCGR_PEP_ID=MMETSP0125-20121206/12607_1 /TAXON_ID=485358 ORGANISM="Aristerostoma sp., Strain ATCC 50986" /NCGR_SAMPLE_ID=MMETSP0125 /ASSEMBLY_ACC=CAM_ASM_000245 /LENGTH=119 /DNA_ID=CAMNT_0001787767 /DNA_START=1362 /DNA_END=1718 /DNA_ORIENTATION=+